MTSTPTALPRLLHFRVSHFNEKIRWALDYKKIPHIRQTLVPGFHIPVARLHSGQNKTPILIFNDLTLAGSDRILMELEKRYPNPPLFPESPAERKTVFEIQNYFDNEVAPEVRAIFWSYYLADSFHARRMMADGSRPMTKGILKLLFPVMKPLFVRNIGTQKERIQRAKERLASHFEFLEKKIDANGYLVGDRFTAADLTAAAVMTALVRPKEFPYPLPRPYPNEFELFQKQYENRPGWKWTNEIYAKHRGKSFEANGNALKV